MSLLTIALYAMLGWALGWEPAAVLFLIQLSLSLEHPRCRSRT